MAHHLQWEYQGFLDKKEIMAFTLELLQQFSPLQVLIGYSKNSTHIYVQLLSPLRTRQFGVKKFKFRENEAEFRANIRNPSFFWEKINFKSKCKKKVFVSSIYQNPSEANRENLTCSNERNIKSEEPAFDSQEEEFNRVEEYCERDQMMKDLIKYKQEQETSKETILNHRNQLTNHLKFISKLKAYNDNLRLQLLKANIELQELKSFKEKLFIQHSSNMEKG